MTTVNEAVNNLYVDFDIDFTINDKKDISLITGIDSINNSLNNIIFSNWDETPFNPNFGSDLGNLIGDNHSKGMVKFLKDNIIEQIKNNENRVEVINVKVEYHKSDYLYFITVFYKYKNLEYDYSVYFK